MVLNTVASPVARPLRATATSRGFTLIEIAVVLAVTVSILLVSAPLTVSWADSARVTETRALLQQAHTRARAIALRNTAGAIGGAPAALVCMEANTLYVHQGVPSGCTVGAAWQQEVPGGERTSITVGGEPLGCIAVANTGRPVAFSFDGDTCTTAIAFRVARGDEEIDGELR